MKELLLIIFLVSLFYMSIANRMRNYVKILIMQGALLFLVAVIQLHEVMILDNSGFDLGMIFCAGYLKFAMYGALVADMFLGSLPAGIAIPVFFGVQILCASVIGIVESFMARYRMNHNPQFIFALSSVAMLLVFGVMMLAGKM